MKNVGFPRNKTKQFFIKTQYISGYWPIFRSYIRFIGLDNTYINLIRKSILETRWNHRDPASMFPWKLKNWMEIMRCWGKMVSLLDVQQLKLVCRWQNSNFNVFLVYKNMYCFGKGLPSSAPVCLEFWL